MVDHNNKSDYTKPFMDLQKYLPDPLQSDVNISLFNNLFNRFLSKQEIEKVAGYIGRGNMVALTSRQIKENDVHRQAFQLQPILNNKIGSIEHMASWKDIENELERSGVDIADFANWGAIQSFNWVPPVDINKLINYKDYYWVDDTNTSPQYITIRNKCTTATARETFWENIIDQYGSTFPIVDILEIDDRSKLPVYSITAIDNISGFVDITGNATNDLLNDNYFDIDNTTNNDGTYQITTVPIYDGTTNTTRLIVNGLSSYETVGSVLLHRFDKIAFGANNTITDGDYTKLFEKDFIFFLRNTNNIELDNKFIKIVSSVSDLDNIRTIVTIEIFITDDNFAVGEASLEEQLAIFVDEKNCYCDTLYGSPAGGCDTLLRIEGVDQWIKENKWEHKNNITNLTSTRRASQPIIEYDWDLELNEWTYIGYRWSYRAEIDDTFIETENTPPLIELEPITWWELESSIDLTNTTIILDFRYGDLSDYFTSGKQLYIGNSTTIILYEVDYSEYKSFPTDDYAYRTYVTFKTRPTNSTGNLNNVQPNSFDLYPFETEAGDPWKGYGAHWLFLGNKDAVPVPHQVDNTYIPVSDEAMVSLNSPLEYDYTTSLYSQNNLVLIQYNKFELAQATSLEDNIPVPVDTRSLRHKALFGFDDIRIYINDPTAKTTIRQFGNYDEIGEAVLDVIGVDFATNEFIVNINNTEDYFKSTSFDKIRLYGNMGIGIQEFVVAAGGTGGRIKVVIPIPSNTSVDGEIFNLTNPLSTEAYPDAGFTNTKDITMYVMGIKFFDDIPVGNTVIIEVGEAAMNELGSAYTKIRTIEDEDQFLINGNTPISQIKYRRVEQVKTKINQYPLFDIFTIDGLPAFKASPIFGYRTSSESEINQNTGLRIVFDSLNNIYEYDQFLLDEDNGELFAYRDYANKQEDFWYNSETNVLRFWKETEWDEKTEMSNQYRKAVISDIEPSVREREIDGLYWYNTTLNKLYKRYIDSGSFTGVWNEISAFDLFVTDINLQTIWKAGLNNELYIPDQVDWYRRSKEEYDIEQTTFVTNRVAELMAEDLILTEADATIIAEQEWYARQSNDLSDGTWVGDWEIPDPLYYNNLHENRKYLTSRELLTHFTTIVNEQPKIPGYVGTADGMFNLIPSNDVNYGLGGTIKEFNDGFDLMLSSMFVNNVTPRSLIDFAYSQYEGLLNSLKEIYRGNAVDLFSNTEISNILNLSSYVAVAVIEKYELNDQAAFIYGDTTTFTDIDGVNDLGVRNWIATLPYVNIINKHVPERIIDDQLSLDEVVHHDGHRNGYSLTSATADVISRLIIKNIDQRTISNTMGESSIDLPPNNITEFESEFGTLISNREGVYWYYTPAATSNILYRYVVAESGTNVPSSTYIDGTLWMDLTSGLEVLRIKNTDYQDIITWDIVDGLTLGDGRLHNGTDFSDVNSAMVSAWQIIDLNVILGDIVFELETRLYDNVPSFSKLAYDFENTAEKNSEKNKKYLEEAFLDYVSQLNISTPYKNSNFSSADAFTWNYKRSVSGGGFNILEADAVTNSFLIEGNRVSVFDICTASSPSFASCPSTTTFFIKNSDINDGTWTTLTSTSIKPTTFYNSIDNTTRIFVNGNVLDSFKGVIYSGLLPSLKTTTSPNNLNTGIESGGDWRDLYTKIYGTPYPHIEPWALQGYNIKPDWWDEEYLNTDVDQWGNRRWKYKHGFEIVAADNDSISSIGSPLSPFGTFTINGNFYTNFVSGEIFTIDNSNGSPNNDNNYEVGKHDTIINVNPGPVGSASIVIDDTAHVATEKYSAGMFFAVSEPTINPNINAIIKTYTINNVSHVGDTFTITTNEEIITGELTPNISFINGAMYNPLTNFTEIKVPGLVNNNSSGRIVYALGMWENIRIGIIPPGKSYPNGIIGITGIPSEDTLNGLSIPDLPTFNYFSVNIGNISISADGGITVYNSDSIFPPYWDYISTFSGIPTGLDATVRSLYFDFSTEIIVPNADYIFNDSGTIEWEWRTSSQFLYDQLTVAYRIDPSRYVSSTFGFNFTELDGLQIDRNTKRTPSHTRIDFHGDVVNDTQFISNGLNQWYVNFNRYSGYDANASDFKELWTGWTAPLTYQFASFVDTSSLNIGHRYVSITSLDYNITSKRAAGVDDFWLDAFKIGIINIPYDLLRYDSNLEWRFELKTNINISRNIKYYDVHNYQFYTDLTTDECWLYTWKIENIDTFDKIFTVFGDQTYVFSEGRQFDIIGSTGNNGTYDVITSSYDSIANTTLIAVNNIILSAIKDGLLKANYREIPWETGDSVYLSTAETLPIPLLGDTINGLTQYFIIKESSTKFKLAETKQNALDNVIIDITSSGRRDQFIGEIINAFLADNSNTNWRLYTIDKTNILEINTPHEVQGMQTLVNIIHGYSIYINDQGWKINSDNLQIDPDSLKIINWQVEIERFISYAYSLRTMRAQITDRYPVTVDITINIWTFSSENKTFITGDPINIISSNNIFPTPLSRNIRYYIIRDTLETFNLAVSKRDAQDGIAINITSISGVGDLQITSPREFRTLIPEFEINPFRNSIWFEPSRGIVSNIITGPSEDIRTTQLIFNQYGNQIKEDQLRVYRQDKETKIQVVDAFNNTNTIIPPINPVYTLLHLGGLHLFIDTYEHTMILNNYTSEGNLLYDPFIGLNVTKYELLFNKQPEFTHRPNVGGYYLETFFNQGANLKENIEAGVENLRYAYDTHNTLETSLMTQHSRKTLGYEGPSDYLNNLNLSQKSQFLFWRGQIQNKGSINAVNAFINSRRFIDAKIDDFWAVKIGEFGSIKEKEFPEMYVTTIDARSNELRLEFINNEDDETNVEESFTPIKMSNQDRWYNQPDQIKILRNNGRVMYFDLKPKYKMVAGIDLGGSPYNIIDNNNKLYIKHDLDIDTVEITQQNGMTIDVLEEDLHYVVINNNIIKFIKGSGSPPNLNDITIWGMVYNDDAQSPARIIDRESETQISAIQFWDPARGKHYNNAIHNIDLQNDNDPAEYTNTSQTTSYSGNWKESFVGITWLNTENLDYVPYYSKKMIPDTTERFRNWGQLADWSEIEIFEWVESDVLPSEWDALAEIEEGDRTIIESLRKSGTVRKILLEKENGSPSIWIPAVNKVEEQYVATEAELLGSPAVEYYTFTVPLGKFKATGSPLQYLVNVYINGKIFATDAEIKLLGSPNIIGTYEISTLYVKESDVVRFVQLVPMDQTIIDAEIKTGTMLQEYQYSQVAFYDDLRNIYYKYYFWVNNKATKPLNENRTMSILEAEIQLASIPAAYMFFQGIKTVSNMPVEIINISRVEIQIAPPGSPVEQTYGFELSVVPNTTILVEVNGMDLPNDGTAYIIGGSPLEVTIINPLPDGNNLAVGDEVKLSYTGTINSNENTTIPHRFTQVVIRGLQGIVNADNRYTIKFTRNFTLRDRLDIENVNIGDVDLKNLHEEWKLFRQEQEYNIDRWQWDRITESIIGYKLDDSSIRVPSYERELYDEKYDTDTQYGLEDGQTFANGLLALSSVVAYLLDPNVDFTPIDINAFFTANNFDTPDNIISAMDEIYNTFTFTHVNRIFFSVLNDAFTTKAKHPSIFKTSMVSLHGVKPFNTLGYFDT